MSTRPFAMCNPSCIRPRRSGCHRRTPHHPPSSCLHMKSNNRADLSTNIRTLSCTDSSNHHPTTSFRHRNRHSAATRSQQVIHLHKPRSMSKCFRNCMLERCMSNPPPQYKSIRIHPRQLHYYHHTLHSRHVYLKMICPYVHVSSGYRTTHQLTSIYGIHIRIKIEFFIFK